MHCNRILPCTAHGTTIMTKRHKTMTVVKRTLLMIVALLMPAATKAQTLVDNYRFFTNVATTEWIDIDGIDSVIIAPTETVNSIASNRIATGFTFMLGGTACNYFSANVNGTICLSSTRINPSGIYNQPLGSSYGSSSRLPKVEPFGWRGQMDSSCYTRYAVLGDSGDHVLVVETRMGVYGQDSSYVSFQLQLHEASGELRIVYGPASGSLPQCATQTGLMRSPSDRIFIDIATNSAHRSATDITLTNAAGEWPEAWRSWSLMPAPAVCPYPGEITIVSNDPDSTVLAWPADSGATYHLTIAGTGIDTILSGPSFTISRLLNGGSTYNGTLRTLCSNGDSSFRAREFSFTTAAGAVNSLPFVADFNDAASTANWDYSISASSVPRWQRKTNNPSPRMYTGNIDNPEYDATAWLVSPLILMPYGDVSLMWDYRSGLANVQYYGIPTIDVLVSVCDSSNTIDTSAALWDTLMTMQSIVPSFRTYGLTMESYGGHRVRVAFVRRGKCFGSADIDNVRIGTGDTLVRIDAPLHPMVGEQTDIRALTTGGDPMVPHLWHSTMADAGAAIMYDNGTSTISLIYITTGHDTLTVQHGNVADTLVLLVKDCATVYTYPWSDDFENSADCWTLPDDYSWAPKRYAGNAYSGTCWMYSHQNTSTNHTRLISPTFVMPDHGNITGLAMTFQVRAIYTNTNTHLSVYFIPDSADGGAETLVFDTLVGWNIYSQCIVPLDGAAGLEGRSGRFALEHWSTTSSAKDLYLDDVCIRYVNDPVVELTAPQHAYIGEPETLVATITEGQPEGLVFTWHSAMLNAGQADTSSGGSDGTLNIVYNNSGTDTIIVTATNSYSTSADTATIQVCAPIEVAPWQADLSSHECWYIVEGSTWTFANGRLQAWGDLYQEGTAVTPAIVVPADTGAVLNWRAYGNAIYTVSVTTGRYDDQASYTTVLLDTATSADGTLQHSINLDAYAGDTIHVAFHLDYQYNVVRIDSLILTNRNAPLILFDAPQHVFADGATTLRTELTRGNPATMNYMWRSTMATRGAATMLSTGQPDLNISYHTLGTDTVWVVVSNAFGSDSAMGIFTISDCDTVQAESWTVNFNTDYDCWYRPAGCNWALGNNQIYSSVSNVPFDSRIISQAIAVPAWADDSLVVEWTANATGSQQAHTLYMLISDGDYTDPTQWDTLVADTTTYYLPKTYRVPLTAYANNVIHIAFVNNPVTLSAFAIDYRYLNIYGLHVVSLRKPAVSLAMPPTAHAGQAATVRAVLADGSPTGLTYSWHSTMAAAGLATDTAMGDTLRLVYNTVGTDTITVVATNAYGTDTATATLTVLGCAAIDTLPWNPWLRDYSSLTCWQRLDFSTWTNSRWMLNGYSYLRSYAPHSNDTANNWLVTPAIELPAALDGSTLRWTAKGMTQTAEGVIHHPYMDVLLTTGDATDTSTYSHVLFGDHLFTGDQRTYEVSLDSFAGQTVHIAFVHRGTEGGYIQMDAIGIENGGRPELAVTPPTALHVGEPGTFEAHIVRGARSGLAFTWHSTLTGATWTDASPAAPRSLFTISHTAAGTDTITCIATNAYGSDTAVVTMPVNNCPAVTLPWYEDFADSTSAECWSTFAYHWNDYLEYERTEGSWQWTALGRMQVTSLAYDYLVTPAITLPAVTTGNDIVLAWEQSSYHVPMCVVVSPTGRYGGEEDFTDTLGQFHTPEAYHVSLAAYGGSTVRVAFVANYAFSSALWLDDVAVFLQSDTAHGPDTVWRTVTVSTNADGACETYGSGLYADSSTVEIGYTLADSVAEGGHWQFVGWSDGESDTPRNILVVSDTTVTALFQWVADSVGISEFQAPTSDIRVHPNPTCGDVTVSVGQPSTVSVVDITGRTVIPPTPIISDLRLPTSDLPAGSYFVRFVSEHETAVRKLVVR